MYDDGDIGLAKEAPFDRIISTCAFSNTPESLIAQLAPKGRLVAVVNNILTIFYSILYWLEAKVLFPLRLPLIEVENQNFYEGVIIVFKITTKLSLFFFVSLV